MKITHEMVDNMQKDGHKRALVIARRLNIAALIYVTGFYLTYGYKAAEYRGQQSGRYPKGEMSDAVARGVFWPIYWPGVFTEWLFTKRETKLEQ